MARAYRMTSARRAAIRKAQLASARKRRGRRNKKIAAGVALAGAGVIGVTMYASKGRGKGKGKSGKNSTAINTVSQTMAAPSKSLDIIRSTS